MVYRYGSWSFKRSIIGLNFLILKHTLIISVILFTLASCKKEPKPGLPNPVANAGPDKTIFLPTESVMLDGSRSLGTITGYAWNQITGPSTAVFGNASAVNTLANKLIAGIYKFELQVTGNGVSSKDTLQVSVYDPSKNHPPVAVAGPDQRIGLPTSTVNLDGSNSTDPDNNIKTYKWRMISGSTVFNATFTPAGDKMQVFNLENSIYLFELTVTDFFDLVSKDTVKVLVDPANCVSGRPEVNAQLTQVGTLSRPRSRLIAVSAANKIVYAGVNSTRIDIYDIVTNTFSTAELPRVRFDISAAANGNKIFFAGGDDIVDIYDVASGSWSFARLTEPRVNITATTIGNKVFFAGGYSDNTGYARTTTDIYDLSTNSWSVYQLSEARESPSVVIIDNKIYFAGGSLDGGWLVSSRIDIYDNGSNSWSTSSLMKPRFAMAAITAGNKIYWAGGAQGEPWNPSCNVEIRDVTTQTSSTASLFIPGIWTASSGTNAVIRNNRIAFIRLQAGIFGHSYSDKFDIYNINNNSWSIGVLPHLISGASIISVNNIIYIAGGLVDGVLSDKVWKLEF